MVGPGDGECGDVVAVYSGEGGVALAAFVVGDVGPVDVGLGERDGGGDEQEERDGADHGGLHHTDDGGVVFGRCDDAHHVEFQASIFFFVADGRISSLRFKHHFSGNRQKGGHR